jgi:hypothetical protein
MESHGELEYVFEFEADVSDGLTHNYKRAPRSQESSASRVCPHKESGASLGLSVVLASLKLHEAELKIIHLTHFQYTICSRR